MGRPHIEFIQSQVLPWRKGLYGGARPDVHHRVLSIDKRNLDSSLLLRYPAGWRRPWPMRLAQSPCGQPMLLLQNTRLQSFPLHRFKPCNSQVRRPSSSFSNNGIWNRDHRVGRYHSRHCCLG